MHVFIYVVKICGDLLDSTRGVNGSGRVILFYYLLILPEPDPFKFRSKNISPYPTHVK
jgi:hypothetical protein